MSDYIYEVPHYSPMSGGIMRMIDAARTHGAQVRFQTVLDEWPIPDDIGVPYTIGPADATFPDCDYVVTYSNNPHTSTLLALPQVGRVGVLMLSFGRWKDEERANVLLLPNTVMTTTQRTRDKILVETGVEATVVGMGLRMGAFGLDFRILRKRYFAVYYHHSKNKRYPLAVKVAEQLCVQGLAEGIVSFGVRKGYDKVIESTWLIYHVEDASTSDVRKIFNLCSLFIMPSASEGLNRTPAEATLCGCPAVLCDGAIGELYVDKVNCMIAPNNGNVNDLYDAVVWTLQNADAEAWRADMAERVAKYPMEDMVANIQKVMEGSVTPVEAQPEPIPEITTESLPEKPKYVASIIIPVHGQLELLKRCVASIEAKTHSPYALIIVDDGSTDPAVWEYCEELGATKRAFSIGRNTPSRGFSEACNLGIRLARESTNSDYYILLNSDTEIGTDDWLAAIIDYGNTDPNIGLMGPVSNNAISQSICGHGASIPAGRTVDDMARIVADVTEFRRPYVTLVNGFCYIMRREMVDNIGVLDATEFPHYGSEDDYSLRAKILGYKAVILDHVFVAHVHSASYSREGRKPLAKASRRKLCEKYGTVEINEAVERDNKALDYLRAKMKERLAVEKAPEHSVEVVATPDCRPVAAIVTHNDPEAALLLVDCLFRHDPAAECGDIGVIVVDDGSEPQCRARLRDNLQRRFSRVGMAQFPNRIECGGVLNWLYGQFPDSPHYFLLDANEDIVIVSDVLSRLSAILRNDRGIGIACPSTSHRATFEGLFQLNQRRAHEVAIGENPPYASVGDSDSVVATPCIAVRRQVLTDVGLCDTSYPWGYESLNDLETRAAYCGWRNVFAQDCCIRYENRYPSAEATKVAEEMFRSRWLREPEISIIVPAYNCGRYLWNCLRSLQNQTFTNREIIVVDDASQDETQTVLSHFNVVKLRNARNLGANTTRMKGYRVSRGKYIVFCDADAVYEPNYLAELHAALKDASPDIGYAYCDFRIDGRMHGTHYAGAWSEQKLTTLNFVDFPSLVRRSAFPGLDVSLPRLQDWDVWLTMMKAGYKGVYVPKTLYTSIKRNEGISGRGAVDRVLQTASLKEKHGI
jgi:GT2 family glycosyltransferase